MQVNIQKIGIIRVHLALESKLNWELDVSYSECIYKLNKGGGSEDIVVLRLAIYSLLRIIKKAGIKSVDSKARWDKDYMLEILGFNY